METSQGNAQEVHCGAAGKANEGLDQVCLALSFKMFKCCVMWAGRINARVSRNSNSVVHLKKILSAAVDISEVVLYFCKLPRLAHQQIVWETQWRQ